MGNRFSIPKSEEVLGLKNLVTCNQSCVLKDLWRIYMEDASLWIAWIHSYILPGHNIMEIPSLQGYSWNIKKVLKLRSLAVRFIQSNVVCKLPTATFPPSAVYEVLSQKNYQVNWKRLLWYSCNLPKP